MLNLAFRSVMVLGVLFGLLFAVLVALLFALHLPSAAALPLGLAIAVAVSALQFWISPYILQWIMKIHWVEPEQVSPALGRVLRAMCAQRGLKVPRFGLIEDGNPNAFTFGHYPGDARLVLTRGILDLCNEEEQAAVIGHELGHIVHWDFVVMTVAATVPLILYIVYRFGIGAGRGSRRGGGYVMLVALGAFVAYIISEYVVLALSRVREYYADQFSSQATGSPNALATALVKIAYGLARAEPKQTGKGARAEFSVAAAGGAKMMGIFDPKFGGSMALASAAAYSAGTRTYDKAVTVNAMKWDIWNPWALMAELSSSHPLPAKRIRHLEQIARAMGQAPAYDLPGRAPESYWDEFATDLFYNYLPVAGFLTGGVAGLALAGFHETSWLLALGAAIGGWAIANLIRLGFAYPKGRFRDQKVASLVGEVKVSGIRCLPAVLRGRVIGRGIPGLYWSSDLVVQDDTGFMVLNYRQPLRVFEFLFGLFRAESFIGQEIVVQGWYRRYPRPFLEIFKVYLPDGTINTSHNWAAKFWGTILALAAAFFMVLLGIGMVVGR